VARRRFAIADAADACGDSSAGAENAFSGGAAANAEDGGAASCCETIFFPGCVLLGRAPHVAYRAYELLRERALVDGTSVLCCGKVLDYDPTVREKRDFVARSLAEMLAAHRVKRVVAACPNCVVALRRCIAAAGGMTEVVALPQVLADAGIRVDVPAWAPLPLAVHDPCPDRRRCEFADGLRALMPADALVEKAHSRTTTRCCGSKARSAGDAERMHADAWSRLHEAQDAGARGIVTSCMSCAVLLSWVGKTSADPASAESAASASSASAAPPVVSQPADPASAAPPAASSASAPVASPAPSSAVLPAYHYLELLFDEPIVRDGSYPPTPFRLFPGFPAESAIISPDRK